MKQRLVEIYFDEFEHTQRFMLCMVAALLIAISVFKLWPVSDKEERISYESIYQEEEILIDNAIVTRQSSLPPPPPKPLVPVPVPDDEVIPEDYDFPDVEDLFDDNELYDESEEIQLGSSEGRLVGDPQQGPRLVKIVEPTISETAKNQNIKAQIIVTFLVGTDGNIEDVFVSEIRLYDGNDYKVVDQIGYGILEATLEAATKWKFIPAKDDGENVKTYVENSFNIGF